MEGVIRSRKRQAPVEAEVDAKSASFEEGPASRQGRRLPHPQVYKSQLSAGRQWLVEAMQRLGFGRIKHLVIANGEPLTSPPPRMYRRHRLTGPNRQRSETDLRDFILKEQVVKLFQELDRIRNGVVAALDVRDGLPCDMTLEESGRP